MAHIEAKNGKKDFSLVINKALALGGFKVDVAAKEITVGFAHQTVLSLADKIIAAVKAKQVRHFFLIGGCDGAKMGRNYYTEFAQKVPQDCIILTLACGKFRFNTLDFGSIGPFPRLLDCGQCNDAYSAIAIAAALAKAFNCGFNDLPLSLILSWYEQKAVCILLTLLSLGIKNIRLGPTLPRLFSGRAQGAGGKVQYSAHHHAGSGSESDFRITPIDRVEGKHPSIRPNVLTMLELKRSGAYSGSLRMCARQGVAACTNNS